MRKILVILLLVAGVVALCGYGAKHHARHIEQIVSDGASGAVAISVHGLKTTVDGRDIEVSGVADSAAERDKILDTLNIVEGRRLVRDRMTVLDSVSPYTFSAEKSDNGVTVSGYMPTEIAREGIAVVLDRDVPELELASGAPVGWTIAAQDGLSALGKLKRGQLTMSDRTLSLSGEASTQADGEAAIAELKDVPSDYTVRTSF